ncbi:putative dehydrogenase [Kitasatospora sp. GP30]|nr:putative dehydrogenase [Kitasatospora sp. GP30]
MVGCGRISPAYLTAPGRFPNLRVVACSDLDVTRAEKRAQQFGVPIACDVDSLIAMPDVDVVVNLTPPAVHHQVSTAAVRAGKSVYVEKPLAVDREQAAELLELARSHGVEVACSPDTFLSPVLQTCRSLLDQGAIGTPVGAVAFFATRGPELRHPDPAFFYQQGAGPLLDMGPYYVTALVNVLGPVRRVSAASTSGESERLVMSGPQRGSLVPVQVPTHVSANLEFESGTVCSLMTSFDVWAANLPRIEIYGTEGSLSIPDPDGYEGQVRLHQAGWTAWREVPGPQYTAGRGIGLADLAAALHGDRTPRAGGALAYHVLDTLLSVLESGQRGTHINVESSCIRPDQVGAGGVIDVP